MVPPKCFKFLRGSIAEDYEIEGFRFLGCSKLYFDREILRPYRFKMYLHIETNSIITADIIYNDHPLYDIVYETI
jgi:hypothetical protein